MRAKSLVASLFLLLLCAVHFGAAQDEPEFETEGQRDKRFQTLKEAAETEAKTATEALRDFNSSRDFKEEKRAKDVREKLATRVVDATAGPDVSYTDAAAAGIALHDDNFTDLARALLVTAWKGMRAAGQEAHQVVRDAPGGGERNVWVPNTLFVEVVTRLGWVTYKRSPELDECALYDVDGWHEAEAAWTGVDEWYHRVRHYPPEFARRLETTSAAALESLRLLKEQDAKDGFAIKARQAWLRFEDAQKAGKVDRKKGKRSFSPKAMGREGENFRDIWTYQYRKPFVAYIEKPFDATLEQRQVDEVLNLLGHFHAWFSENLIQPWELMRVKPNDYAEQAETDGWPLEVILFGGWSLDRYIDDTTGSRIPGVSAFYSVLDERLVAELGNVNGYVDPFRQAMLVHETCHYLSDLYASGPQFSMVEMQTRPRSSSVLVQEGFADFVSGVKKEGEGANAQYAFGELNTLRLKDFKAAYDILGNKVLFRLRDLPDCRHYGQCNSKAQEQAKAQELKVNALWLQQIAVSTYYATACQAAYFFHHFKKDNKYVYRDKWWAFLKDEYQGKHILKSYDDNAGVDAFKAAFEIKEDADWDTIEAEFLEFTLALKRPDEE